MTTIELLWFLLKNIIFHPKCINKVVGTIEGAQEFYLGEISYAIRIKNAEHAQKLWLGEILCDGEEDDYKNTIVLG